MHLHSSTMLADFRLTQLPGPPHAPRPKTQISRLAALRHVITHTHTHTQKRAQTHSYIHEHARTRTRTRACTSHTRASGIRAHLRTHSACFMMLILAFCTHMFSQTHAALAHIHSHTRIYTHSHTHIHTHTTNEHKHTHTYTHACTHTHV